MAVEPAVADRFDEVFSRLALDSETLRQPVDATFIPAGAARQVPSPLDSLPELALDDGTEAAPELSIATLLGEGGRGEVRLARQLSLRRQVAVKSPKNLGSAEVAAELLREARITGGLEHPNIIPIYSLGRDSRGRVLLVMKKLNGAPWGKLLRDEGPRRTPAQLEKHLEIFRQVCNAVEFAHSQGIVHRDLKPDNVVLGAFGEVVLLDWGLAVSLQGDPERGLPPAREVRGLAGTPAYMAPELVTGDGSKLGPWTDVYLLGAILHEIATGAAPHTGGPLTQVLERAYRSLPPSYGPEVPAELAAICRKAMEKDPKKRHASVAELRQAVHHYGWHRQSHELAEEAMRRLRGLALAESNVPAEEVAAAQLALAQCRFGFEQALKGWPENPVAREGLAETAERELDLAIRQGDLPGALRILRSLERPRPEQVKRVDMLRARLAAQAEEVERLRAFSRELDPQVSRGGRSFVLGFTAVVWSLIPFTVGMLERSEKLELTSALLLWGMVPYTVFMAMAIWYARRSLLGNRVGRRMTHGVAIMVAGAGLVRLAAYLAEIDPHVTFSFEMGLYAILCALASMFETRFVSAAVVYVLASLACAVRPEQCAFISAAANLTALLPIGVLWDHFAGEAE